MLSPIKTAANLLRDLLTQVECAKILLKSLHSEILDGCHSGNLGILQLTSLKILDRLH